MNPFVKVSDTLVLNLASVTYVTLKDAGSCVHFAHQHAVELDAEQTAKLLEATRCCEEKVDEPSFLDQ